MRFPKDFLRLVWMPRILPCGLPPWRVAPLHQDGWRASGPAWLDRTPLWTGTAPADSDGSGSRTRSAPAGSMVLLFLRLPRKRHELGRRAGAATRTLRRAFLLQAVTAAPAAGSRPHRADPLPLVPWPKPSEKKRLFLPAPQFSCV